MKTFYDESLRLLKEIPANNPSLRSWAIDHLVAIERPRAGISSAIGQLISGLIAYAEEHQAAYDSPISDDYVLGPAHEQIAQGIQALLCGEIGRFDGGTLDGIVRQYMPKDEQ